MTRLRRVEPRDLPVLDAEHTSKESAGEHSWFGYRDPGYAARKIEAGETLQAERGMLAIVDDDDSAVGLLTWLKVFNGPPPNGDCWNMGIWLAPQHRGKGHGSAAQRLGAAYLFEHTLMERVEAGTEGENVAEQKALEKAGFTREATLRRACFRGGKWHDMVVFSKLRGEA